MREHNIWFQAHIHAWKMFRGPRIISGCFVPAGEKKSTSKSGKRARRSFRRIEFAVSGDKAKGQGWPRGWPYILEEETLSFETKTREITHFSVA